MRKNTWWSEVSGPSRFIDAATDTVASQKSCILALPKEIPFEEEFYLLLQSRLESELAGQEVEILESVSGYVADFFLNVYCRKELRVAFRPKPGYTAAKFLAEAETSIMHGRGFIVRIQDQAEFREWSSFVSEYASSVPQKITPAVFLLAVQDDSPPKAVRGLKHIDFKEYSSQFDAYAYSAIRASDISERNSIKTYLADLASSLSGGNVEKAEKAIYVYREFLDDPVKFAVKHFCVADEDLLRKKVWESQLRCIFPRIETFRRDFIEEHEKEINIHLGGIVNAFGEPYENTGDVEVQTLFYMVRKGFLQLERDEYEELKLYYTARNELAHLKVLDIETIRTIAG